MRHFKITVSDERDGFRGDPYVSKDVCSIDVKGEDVEAIAVEIFEMLSKRFLNYHNIFLSEIEQVYPKSKVIKAKEAFLKAI